MGKPAGNDPSLVLQKLQPLLPGKALDTGRTGGRGLPGGLPGAPQGQAGETRSPGPPPFPCSPGHTCGPRASRGQWPWCAQVTGAEGTSPATPSSGRLFALNWDTERSINGRPGTSFQRGQEIPPNQLPHFPPANSVEFPFIKLHPNPGCKGGAVDSVTRAGGRAAARMHARTGGPKSRTLTPGSCLTSSPRQALAQRVQPTEEVRTAAILLHRWGHRGFAHRTVQPCLCAGFHNVM